MDDRSAAQSAPRILRAADGVVMGDPAGVRDRFMIDDEDAGGRFALVQHLFAPRPPRTSAMPTRTRRSASSSARA
ncbi:hypothetical protein ACI789_02615 [Geodermatophilus sp. SYSU D00965]